MRAKRALNSQLVGMTSKTEQDYCARYGRKEYTGSGEVVDLGCWLGSTTISLLDGLTQNSTFVDAGKKLYAYDLFLWFNWMNESAVGTNLAGKYKEGDSFLAEFERRTARYSTKIEVHAGDLIEIGWNGKPIEFLLVDAMKSWDLANGIQRHFYPALIPGKSIVLQQDFGYYSAPWIHALQWKLRDYFQFHEEIPGSTSVAFRLVTSLPSELLEKDYSAESFADEEIEAAFKYCMNLVSHEKKPNVAAAKVMWYIYRNRFDQARSTMQTLLEQGVPMTGQMITARDLIKQA
jgi:hypothetical protein